MTLPPARMNLEPLPRALGDGSRTPCDGWGGDGFADEQIPVAAGGGPVDAHDARIRFAHDPHHARRRLCIFWLVALSPHRTSGDAGEANNAPGRLSELRILDRGADVGSTAPTCRRAPDGNLAPTETPRYAASSFFTTGVARVGLLHGVALGGHRAQTHFKRQRRVREARRAPSGLLP